MATSTQSPDAYGIRVRQLREARGWGVRELGRRAELSPALISSLEAGKAERLQPKTKSALTRAFDWPSWEAMMASESLEPPPRTGADGDQDQLRAGAAAELLRVASDLADQKAPPEAIKAVIEAARNQFAALPGWMHTPPHVNDGAMAAALAA